MVQFVNIREFKTQTEAVLRRLDRSDVVLTIRGKPKVVLHKVSEGDFSLREEFASAELDQIERLAKGPGKSYKTVREAKRHLDRLVR